MARGRRGLHAHRAQRAAPHAPHVVLQLGGHRPGLVWLRLECIGWWQGDPRRDADGTGMGGAPGRNAMKSTICVDFRNLRGRREMVRKRLLGVGDACTLVVPAVRRCAWEILAVLRVGRQRSDARYASTSWPASERRSPAVERSGRAGTWGFARVRVPATVASLSCIVAYGAAIVPAPVKCAWRHWLRNTPVRIVLRCGSCGQRAHLYGLALAIELRRHRLRPLSPLEALLARVSRAQALASSGS